MTELRNIISVWICDCLAVRSHYNFYFEGVPENMVAKIRSDPHIRLRMGVHSGPVDQVTDLNDQTNVAGAGINFAQRVMDCGDAGHILISKRVADDLEQDRLWQPLLHQLGEIEVKHGVKLGI